MKIAGAMWSWLVVALVGVIVIAVVVGLSLFPRLNAAQRIIDSGKPAFDKQRVAGDRASITMVSHAVDALDPVVTPQGGAASEVPQLVAFVSQKTSLSQPAVLAALQKNFPHTTALLQAIPLTSVTSELPGLVGFLATTLKMTPAQVETALQTNFPALAQSIGELPVVTSGWNDVPGTAGLTRFNGAPAHTVPQVRTYFSDDVIPVVEKQQGHFRALASKGGAGFLAPLLLILGIIVTVFGLVMAYLAGRGLSAGPVTTAWSVVIVVGAVVVVLVLGLSLFPRLSGGQNLLDKAKPVFNATRVRGDQAGVAMVSHVVDLADPVASPQGGAASEVPRLVAFVATKTGMSQSAVLATLRKNFPHTTALLMAIPLTAVTSETPGLLSFLASTLKMTPTQLDAALKADFPRLYQSIVSLPLVTGGWFNVPGTARLTMFNGTPVRTMPQVRTYLATDVVPFLANRQKDFTEVDTTWPPLTVFAPLLLVVGIVVIGYGAGMLLVSRRSATA